MSFDGLWPLPPSKAVERKTQPLPFVTKPTFLPALDRSSSSLFLGSTGPALRRASRMNTDRQDQRVEAGSCEVLRGSLIFVGASDSAGCCAESVSEAPEPSIA